MVKVIKQEARTPVLVDGEYVNSARFFFSVDGDDDKPTESYNGVLIAQASYCIDVDNVVKYIYNEETGTWSEVSGGSSGGGGSISNDLMTEILETIILVSGNTPIQKIAVEDAADTEIEAEWDKEYDVPGDSLETLTITLPQVTPTTVSSCIKVTILSTTRHADPEDESEDPLLLPPTIILPEGLYIIGGFPEYDGDRWCLTIDNNLTATAMVIPGPVVEETEGETEGET